MNVQILPRLMACVSAGLFALAFAPAHGAAPPDAIVQDLVTQQVPEFAGHELQMITVTYPPGGASKPHRHDAYIMVYVLDGAVEMKVAGAPARVVKTGETFVERPADIHEISRNASKVKPATFLVIALKETSRPLTTGVPVQ